MKSPNLSSRALRYLAALSVALLIASMVVRSRLPRPATASDAWLWEQGETATRLVFIGNNTGRRFDPAPDKIKDPILGLAQQQELCITDRKAIRAVCRAFEMTDRFRWPLPHPSREVLDVYIEKAPYGEHLLLERGPKGYALSRYPQGSAATNPRSVQRFLQALHSAMAKAKRRQAGYSLDFRLIR